MQDILVGAILIAIGVAGVVWLSGPNVEKVTDVKGACTELGNDWAVVYNKRGAPLYHICLPHGAPVRIVDGEPK